MRFSLITSVALVCATAFSSHAQVRVPIHDVRGSAPTRNSLVLEPLAAEAKISTLITTGSVQRQKVIVLLWNQEITNPSLAADMFPFQRERFQQESARAADEVLRSVSPGEVEVTERYSAIAGFAARVSAEGMRRLAQHEYVRAIVPDVPVQKHRVEGNALMSVPQVHARGQRGAGATVAVIDDGVDFTHPELGNGAFPNSVVIGGYDFEYRVEDPAPIRDRSTGQLESHGTSVAAIIAGRGAAGQGIGVAPEAKIVGLRTTTYSEVIAALDWVATNSARFTPNIRVVNMSIGFDGLGFFTSNCDGDVNAVPMRESVARLTSMRIAVVGSAGNETKRNSIQIPGCLSQIISVGAVYDANLGGIGFSDCQDPSTGGDVVACYSNSASYLQLLAPSHAARTAKAGGGHDATFGGTSAAAPYTAGVLALLMSQYPGKNVSEYLGVLKQTGRPIRDAKSGITTPRVDADRAFQALAGNSGGPTGSQTYFIPAVARASGANNTFFQTDMKVFNGGSAAASVEAFLLDTTDNATAYKGTFSVPAGQSIAVNDAVSAVFSLPQGVGGMVLFSNQPLQVTSTTYTTNNICPDKGGTLGQYIPGASASEGGTRLRVYNLVQNSQFRTNLGVLNTKPTPASVTITIRNGNGAVLGQQQVTLGTYGWRQFNRIIEPMGGSSNAYAEITSDSAVLAYASVVDNFTGDPYYVPGRNE